MAKQYENQQDALRDVYTDDQTPAPEVENNTEPVHQEVRHGEEEIKGEAEENRDSTEVKEPEQENEETETDTPEAKEPQEESEVPNYLKSLQLDKIPESKEEIEKILQNVAKRLTDTQSDWTVKSEKLTEQEKALKAIQEEKDALSAKLKEKEQKDIQLSAEEFAEKFARQYDEDPVEAHKELAKQLFEKLQESKSAISPEEQREQIRNELLTLREEEVRASHDDGNEAIDAFIAAVPTDPSLAEEWNKSRQSPDKAYELGKRILKAKEILADPEKYKQSIIEEYKQANKENGSAKAPSKTLSSINSKTGSSSTTSPNYYTDQRAALHSIFGK